MDVEHENGKFIEGKCSVLPCGFHFNSRHLATLRLMDFSSFSSSLLVSLVLSLDLNSRVLQIFLKPFDSLTVNPLCSNIVSKSTDNTSFLKQDYICHVDLLSATERQLHFWQLAKLSAAQL